MTTSPFCAKAPFYIFFFFFFLFDPFVRQYSNCYEKYKNHNKVPWGRISKENMSYHWYANATVKASCQIYVENEWHLINIQLLASGSGDD